MAQHDLTRDIPVILLTARGYALDDADLAVGNIKDVLSKPFSPRLIVQQVQDLLAEAVGHQSSGVGKSSSDSDAPTETA
jgi:CheY-like chemotaxis protein